MTPDGQVVLRLRHRWSDGTTHILFEPTELLERLAVITPRPRINLLLYYGAPVPARAPPLIAAGDEEPAADDAPGVVYDPGPRPDDDDPC